MGAAKRRTPKLSAGTTRSPLRDFKVLTENRRLLCGCGLPWWFLVSLPDPLESLATRKNSEWAHCCLFHKHWPSSTNPTVVTARCCCHAQKSTWREAHTGGWSTGGFVSVDIVPVFLEKWASTSPARGEHAYQISTSIYFPFSTTQVPSWLLIVVMPAKRGQAKSLGR